MIENAPNRRGQYGADEHQNNRLQLIEIELVSPVENKKAGRNQDDIREQEIGRDGGRFIVFGEPFSDQRSAQGGAQRDGKGVDPAAVTNWSNVGLSASLSWLQPTTMAPMKAPAKQPKKVAGEIGIGTLEINNATRAAQNGDRFKIEEMMIG